MSSEKEPARRDFLRGSFAVAAAAVMVPGAAEAKSTEPKARAYAPSFFLPDEWRFVEASVARLIPADNRGPGALEAGVPEYIDRQMNTTYGSGSLWYMRGPFVPDASADLGYQLQLSPREVYRLGIADADGWSGGRYGKRFAELDPARQDTLLTEFEAGTAKFERLPSPIFFSLLLSNTREGFFGDPIHGGNQGLVGWTLVGFPGARADFMDWVERDERYPFPPVSIRGTRA